MWRGIPKGFSGLKSPAISRPLLRSVPQQVAAFATQAAETAVQTSIPTNSQQNASQASLPLLKLGSVKIDQEVFAPYVCLMEHHWGEISNRYMTELHKRGFEWNIYYEVPPEFSISNSAFLPPPENQLPSANDWENPFDERPFLYPIFMPQELDKLMRMPNDQVMKLMGISKEQLLINISNGRFGKHKNKDPPKNEDESKQDKRYVLYRTWRRWDGPRELFIAVLLACCGGILFKIWQWQNWNKREEMWAEYYNSAEDPDTETLEKLFQHIEENE